MKCRRKGLFPNGFAVQNPISTATRRSGESSKLRLELPSMSGMRALTYSTMFGLIAVTGLRISEALGLDNDDVDLDIGVLTIRRGKAGKARLSTYRRQRLQTAESLRYQTRPASRLRASILFRHGKGIRPMRVAHAIIFRWSASESDFALRNGSEAWAGSAYP